MLLLQNILYDKDHSGIDLKGCDLNMWPKNKRFYDVLTKNFTIIILIFSKLHLKVPYHQSMAWINFVGYDLTQLPVGNENQKEARNKHFPSVQIIMF